MPGIRTRSEHRRRIAVREHAAIDHHELVEPFVARSRSCVVATIGRPPATRSRTTGAERALRFARRHRSSVRRARATADAARSRARRRRAAADRRRAVRSSVRAGRRPRALRALRRRCADPRREPIATAADVDVTAPSRRRPRPSPESSNRRLRPAARRRSFPASSVAASASEDRPSPGVGRRPVPRSISGGSTFPIRSVPRLRAHDRDRARTSRLRAPRVPLA